MIFLKSYLVFMIVFGAFASEMYTPSTDTYIFKNLIKKLKFLRGFLFEGPKLFQKCALPKAPPSMNKKADEKDLKYYWYYAAATYFGYDLEKMKGDIWKNLKNDVVDHEVTQDDAYCTLAHITVSEKREEFVVAFRGTLNIPNAKLDLEPFLIKVSVDEKTIGRSIISSLIPNEIPSVSFHRGLYKAQMSLQDQVLEILKKYQKKYPKIKKIVICGHSLGGAMAKICTFNFLNTNAFGGMTIEVYSYGEPRTGTKSFADYLRSQEIVNVNVIARGDIVPHVGPSCLFGTKQDKLFVRTGQEYWINGEKNQRFCKNIEYEDPSCSNSMGPFYTLVDHLHYFNTSLLDVGGQPIQIFQLPYINPLKPPLRKIAELPHIIEKGIITFLKPFDKFTSKYLG